LGSDIGTTITAQIASWQTNVPARRAAWAHTLCNVIGAGLALPFFYTGLYTKAVLAISWWDIGAGTILSTIAVANTLFKLCLFLPLAPQVEMLVKFIVRRKPGDMAVQPVTLETRLLDTPPFAMQQCKREIVRMANTARDALHSAVDGLTQGDRKRIQRTQQLEDVVDDFQLEITSYLVALSQRQLDDEVSRELPVLLHTVNDLERIGDHAVNIAEIAERKIDRGFAFSEDAQTESREIVGEGFQMFEGIIAALANDDVQAAHAALASENKLNRMQVQFRRRHVQRMTDGKCSAEVGVIFIDLVDNVEKIGDHLTNIAQSVIGGIQWEGLDSSGLSGEHKAFNPKSSE